jgi:hypothetical protein
LQPGDLLGDVHGGIVLYESKLFDLRFQIGDGLFEI